MQLHKILGVTCFSLLVLSTFSEAQDAAKERLALLRKQLKDPDDQVRSKAARSLANKDIDARPAVDDLVDSLQNDKVPEVRVACADALCMICYHHRSSEPNKKIVPALIQAMRNDNDTVVRWRACDAFVMIGPVAKEAAPYLLEAINDKDDSRMREIARRSLQYVASPECRKLMPKLIEMFRMGIDDESTAVTVVAVMGKIGTDEEIIVPLLVGAMKSNDPKKLTLRRSAVRALGRLGDKAKPAVPAILTSLQESLKLEADNPANIQGAAIEALGRIGSREALPLLNAIVENPRTSREIAALARSALKQIYRKKGEKINPDTL
jgi:HEAT repeat protein